MKDLIKQLRETPSRSKRELLDKAADAIEQLEQKFNALNSVTVQEWIPVKERLPELNTDVLVCDARYGYFGVWSLEKDECEDKPCWEDDGGWWKSLGDVTHWMPLPEPPKEGIDEIILKQDEMLKRRDALKGKKEG